MESIKPRGFHPMSRLKSMSNAYRGLKILFRSQYNIWLHTIILGIVILMGLYFKLFIFEWIFVILAAGLVFTAEAINTAIEIDINLTSPEYHPYARDTKDVAAAAVLVAAVAAAAIGAIIFLPRILLFVMGKWS